MLHEWTSIAGVFCAVLLLVLCYAEVKRANRSWLLLRLLATLLAVASLGFMAIPIYHTRPINKGNIKRTVVITSGNNNDSINKFLSANPQSPVYFIGTNKQVDLPAKAMHVNNEAGVKQSDIEGRQIHVFGSGLSPEAMERFKANDIIYHQPGFVNGLQSISWNTNLFSGDRLMVQGTYTNPSTSSTKLLLNGFGSTLDNKVVAAGATTIFQLSTIPKFTGRAQYSLLALSGTDTLLNEPVPVEIESLQPLKILMLSASPDFENKFLKSWLTESKYAVAIRTTTSKAKFTTEFVNMPVTRLSNLSVDVLASFDIVIIDGMEWSMLSNADKSAITFSVDQKGLGLIVKADGSPGASFYSRYLRVMPAPGPKVQQVQLVAGDTAVRLPPLSVADPLYLRLDENLVSLLEDRQSRSFAGLLLYGSGRVVVTTLSQSYQWVLGGTKDAYQFVWSQLLTAVARRKNESERWSFADALPVVHSANTIQVVAANDSVPVAQIGATKVYMQQDANNNNSWYGNFWPTTAGWQSFVVSNGTLQYRYVYSENDYATIQSANRSMAIMRYLQGKKEVVKLLDEEGATRERLPLYWFYFLFVAAAGFLWVEKKFL